jgi:hypothetical protein
LVSLNHTDADYTIFNTQIGIYSIAYEIKFGKRSLRFNKWDSATVINISGIKFQKISEKRMQISKVWHGQGLYKGFKK